MAVAHPPMLCDGWGWYVDTENMRPPSNTMQMDLHYHQRRKPRNIVTQKIKTHINSLEIIKEEEEQEKDRIKEEDERRRFHFAERSFLHFCSSVCFSAIIVSIVVLVLC